MDGQVEDLEQLLSRFERECPRPSSADVAAWKVRHPEAVAAIAERAEVLWYRAGLPTIDELVLNSNMTDERKAYWLRDD